jgi:hypothetical protein
VRAALPVTVPRISSIPNFSAATSVVLKIPLVLDHRSMSWKFSKRPVSDTNLALENFRLFQLVHENIFSGNYSMVCPDPLGGSIAEEVILSKICTSPCLLRSHATLLDPAV